MRKAQTELDLAQRAIKWYEEQVIPSHTEPQKNWPEGSLNWRFHQDAIEGSHEHIRRLRSEIAAMTSKEPA